MDLHCPICVRLLTQQAIGDVLVLQCDSCNGTWCDATELASIIHAHIYQSAQDSLVAPPESMPCPKCDIKITATIYAHDSGVPIHKCSSCSGVWLAAGQLKRIAEYRHGSHKTDRLGQALGESYSKSYGFSAIAGWVQSRILSTIVAAALLIAVLMLGGGAIDIFRVTGFAIFPLACIWFSGAFGKLTGIRMGLARPAIDQTTPAIAVAFAGWILMLVGGSVIVYGMLNR